MAPERWRLVAKWSARTISSLILGVVMFAIGVLIVIPRASHGTALTVLTGSMTPGIPVGSIVLDRPVDPGTLHVGDIATYQVAPGTAEYITHRIVKIDTTTTPVTFTFKGDANRGPDIRPVPATAIRGKVWFHLPYLGAIRDAMHTKGGLAGVGIVVLAAYALFQLAGGLNDRRKGGATAADNAEAGPHGVEAAGAAPALQAFAKRGRDRAVPQVMILATLSTTEFDGLAPRTVANLLGGILLDTSADMFTVLLAESAPRAEATTALIESFRPRSLQTALATFEDRRDPQPIELDARALRKLRREDLLTMLDAHV